MQGGVAEVSPEGIRILAEAVTPLAEVSEADLVRRLEELDAADYSAGDMTTKMKAVTEAHWITTQLKSAGKDVPELKNLK